MLGGNEGNGLHLVAPRDPAVLEALRLLAEASTVGVATFDTRMGCHWATPPALRRFVALTGLPPDRAADGLLASSRVFPQWGRGVWRLGGRELPTIRLELQRARERLGAAVLPVLDSDGCTVALVMVLDDGSEEAVPAGADPMWWWQAAVAADLGIVASRASGAIVAVSPRAQDLVGRPTGSLAGLVRSASRSQVEAGHRRFVGGASTAGATPVTLATGGGGLERARLVWMTVAVGPVPVLKLELLRPLRTIGGATESGAFAFEDAYSMVEASPDPILLLEGTHVVAASPSSEAVLGRPAESLVGRHFAALGAPGDGDLERLCDHLARGLERPARLHVSLSAPGGATQPVELHLAPVAGGGGDRTVVVVRRPVEREEGDGGAKRLGTMLAVAELAADAPARLRGCLELLREEVGALAIELVRREPGERNDLERVLEPADGKLSDDGALSQWERLLGTTSGPLVVPSEDAESGCRVVTGLTLPGLAGASWLVVAHLDGPPARELPDRLMRASQVLGWVVTRVERDRQLEALLRERELLRGVLESAGVPAVVTDADSRVEFATDSFGGLLGVGSDELAGIALPELFDGATASRLLGPLQVLLAEGGAWEGEVRGVSRWGAPLKLRLRLECQVGPDGRPTGLVGCVSPPDRGTR